MTAPKVRQGDEGQAAVELALTLPLLVVLALAVAQVVIVARDQLLVVHAARAAGREAAVDDRREEIRKAARSAAPALKPERLSTETSYPGGSSGIVQVVVRYRSPTRVPLVGPLVPDVELVAKAAFRDESPTVRLQATTETTFSQEPRHSTWNPASVGQYRN